MARWLVVFRQRVEFFMSVKYFCGRKQRMYIDKFWCGLLQYSLAADRCLAGCIFDVRACGVVRPIMLHVICQWRKYRTHSSAHVTHQFSINSSCRPSSVCTPSITRGKPSKSWWPTRYPATPPAAISGTCSPSASVYVIALCIACAVYSGVHAVCSTLDPRSSRSQPLELAWCCSLHSWCTCRSMHGIHVHRNLL